MSHLSKLLLLCSLACATACIVPTVEEVEKEEGPAGCNDTDHKCPESFACFDNRCIKVTSDMACTPGTRQACGSDVGECRKGTQLCGADGTYGACENEVAPAREICDDRDNDCDHQVDYWNGPLVVTKVHDLGSWAALVPVRRTPDGKQDTLLTLAAESGSLVVRTLAPDGSLKQRGSLVPSALNIGYEGPALAADGDTVAAAWVERTYQSGSSSWSYKVDLTLLDGSGNRTTQQQLEIPQGALAVSHVRVALNSTHVLVLFNTADGSGGEKVVAYTINRALVVGTLRGPFSFGVAKDGFGNYVTANGTGDGFIVAYEETSPTSGVIVKKAAVITNDGTPLVGAFAVTQVSFNHSPYIAPVKVDALAYTVYYVQNDSGGVKESQILTVKCDRSGCASPQIFATDTHQINSMQVAARPGAGAPDAAIWTWKDPSDNLVVYAATFTDAGVSARTLLRPPGPPVISAALAVMPDSTRYLGYHQDPPPPPSSLAVGASSSEAYLMPFCGP